LTVEPNNVYQGTSVLVSVKNSTNQAVSNADLRVTQLGSNGIWDSDDTYIENSTNTSGEYSLTLNETQEFNLSEDGLFEVHAWKQGFCLESEQFYYNSSSTTTTTTSTTTTLRATSGRGRSYRTSPAKPKKTTSTTAPPTTAPATTSVAQTTTGPPTTSVKATTTPKPTTSIPPPTSLEQGERRVESTILKEAIKEITGKVTAPSIPQEKREKPTKPFSIRDYLPSWRTVWTALALVIILLGATIWQRRPKPKYKTEKSKLQSV